MSGHANAIRRAIGAAPVDYDTRNEGRSALDALLAENQQLREALERIASNQSMTETPGVLDRSYSGIQAQAMKQIARQALAVAVEE